MENRAFFLFVFAILGLGSGASPANAKNPCGLTLTHLKKAFPNLAEEHPKLYRIVDSPAALRLSTKAEPDWAALAQALSACGPLCELSLSTNNFVFRGSSLALELPVVMQASEPTAESQ